MFKSGKHLFVQTVILKCLISKTSSLIVELSLKKSCSSLRRLIILQTVSKPGTGLKNFIRAKYQHMFLKLKYGSHSITFGQIRKQKQHFDGSNKKAEPTSTWFSSHSMVLSFMKYHKVHLCCKGCFCSGFGEKLKNDETAK